jgi:hypothetical protein
MRTSAVVRWQRLKGVGTARVAARTSPRNSPRQGSLNLLYFRVPWLGLHCRRARPGREYTSGLPLAVIDRGAHAKADTVEPESRFRPKDRSCAARDAPVREKSGTLAPICAPSFLLAGLVFDDGLDLLLHRFQIEGSRILHRREVNGSLGKIGDLLLNEHEAPELPGIEVIHIAAAKIV